MPSFSKKIRRKNDLCIYEAGGYNFHHLCSIFRTMDHQGEKRIKGPNPQSHNKNPAFGVLTSTIRCKTILCSAPWGEIRASLFIERNHMPPVMMLAFSECYFTFLFRNASQYRPGFDALIRSHLLSPLSSPPCSLFRTEITEGNLFSHTVLCAVPRSC